jgi:hypothetical protein
MSTSETMLARSQKIAAACDGLYIEGPIESLTEFIRLTEYIRRRPSMAKQHPGLVGLLNVLHGELSKVGAV